MKFGKIQVLEYEFYVIINKNHIIYIDTDNKLMPCFIKQLNLQKTNINDIFKINNNQNQERDFLIIQKQLKEYFLGKRKNFDFSYDLIGSDFSKQVWKELEKVPYGTTISYRDLAIRLGDSKKTRAVANAVGKNPLLILIPCHRIIGSDGSLRGFRSGLDMKKRLLDIEGITY